ncbi:MAG TPA: hypothetical protein VGP82_17330 [Ktedonobacterales bacterium]|nr:hypothetical protein [Ktedonobacterales bacterium]
METNGTGGPGGLLPLSESRSRAPESRALVASARCDEERLTVTLVDRRELSARPIVVGFATCRIILRLDYLSE